MKICVYAISLNEEKFVKNFYNSCKEADLILLADTGSTDSTVEIAKNLGIQVRDIYINPWRFDHARNTALALIPKDYDVCISLDLDEELLPGWRDEIEKVWSPTTTQLQHRFNNGSDNIYNAVRVHKRTGYTWHHLCHEIIKIDSRVTEVFAVSDKILIEHKPDQTKSRGQYLPMLEAAVKENPYSSRNRFYLAREYWYHNLYEDSIREFEKYLTMPDSTWYHERCFALRIIGSCHLRLGRNDQALTKYRQAIEQARHIREPWLDLAQACYDLKQWSECFYAATSGLAITTNDYAYTGDSIVWGEKLYDLAAISAYYLGYKEQAKYYGDLACEANPTDQRLQENTKFYNAKDN